MAVDQLPGRMREFVAYLEGLLARLDQGAGWCAVFWQRDPDGMQACLEGREVPPWDVVEALLQDLAAQYGHEVAHGEAERGRPLHSAAQAAYDARPGGRDALGDRFDVMLREQRYAAERQAELGRRLTTATTREEADAIRLDLAWARDDHERAVRRCAELQSRMAELDRRTMGDRADVTRGGQAGNTGMFHRGRAGDAGAFRGTYGDGGPGDHAWSDDQVSRGGSGTAHGSGGRGDDGRAGGIRAGVWQGGGGRAGDGQGSGTGPGGAPGTGFPDMPQQRGTLSAAVESARGGSASQRPAPGAAAGPGPAEGARSGHGTQPTAPDDTVRPAHGTHRPIEADAFDRAYGPQQTPTATDPAGQAPRTDTRPDPTRPAPPAAEPPQASASKQRKRRRGSARFAGMGEAEADPVVVPPTAPAPELPAAPAARGRTPRGARFAGAADDVRPQAQSEPSAADGATARRETAETVAALVRLRSEGRTGEAHALLVEAAHWPADRFPLLAAELQHAGLGADWATLLWEAASLPADRLVAAADALVAAGRSADGEQILRQGVARPAGEIGAAVLALVADGRRREVTALLDAYVRVRTPEEAARSAEPGPRTLVPLLLEAAKGVSQERHWDLVHALRVAGFSA
ncbi:hypothetical protein IOD14_12635 [Streptomyces sp. A2-16]|uniref:hypothetical protein n=1 Tax=Streptomyces sp. A2-16 TaxID=2781734 RepID=UPI001BAF44A7|nr:hypothetical protein [Streptomyces sp. A2-16]QUC57578.1 hypothetical protein IOD14_12635 [Streptomyces sp. A2-16]